MKQVLQNLGSRETLLGEVPCPVPRAGSFSHESHEFSPMEGDQAFFIHRFHRFPQMGKRGVLRNLNEAETVILLRKICANLWNLWMTLQSLVAMLTA